MILQGKNVCIETILSGRAVKKVTMKESFHDDIIQTIQKKNISFEFMKDYDFTRLYPDAQGIIIETGEYQYADFDKCISTVRNDSLILILDGIEDPQNLGNILRTFETLGGSFIIIPKNRSCLVNETAMKVSCGAFNYVKVCQVVNLSSTIKILKEHGFWVAGADMKGTTNYDQFPVDSPIALVIGSEGFGITHLVKENCDYLIRIPMVGTINSMNASISAAIIMANIISRRG